MATMTETLLAAKASSGLTFAQLASYVGLDETPIMDKGS